jgi:choline monooxygenase
MEPLFVDSNIARAKTISTEFYTSPSFFEKSKEKIFANSWHFIGDKNTLEQSETVVPVSLIENFLDEPLILTWDKDNNLHCLSNVCTHRGAILIEKPCKVKDIRCRYHGRRFHLNGQFQSMPEFKEVENFPTEEDNLKQLPLHTIGSLLFTSLNKQSNPDRFFEDMLKRIDWMPLDQFAFKPELSTHYEVQAHWALYCENYLEGFHIPFVHAGLNQVIDYGSYTTELFTYSNLQLGLAKGDEIIFDLPTSSPDYGKKVAGYYFWVFPNMMFNFYPWGLSLNIVKPVSRNKTIVSFYSFVWDESKFNQGAGSNLNQVEMEDEAIVESVQKGIRSRFYKHGRYSVKQEKGTHHFHQLISEFMNAQ